MIRINMKYKNVFLNYKMQSNNDSNIKNIKHKKWEHIVKKGEVQSSLSFTTLHSDILPKFRAPLRFRSRRLLVVHYQ